MNNFSPTPGAFVDLLVPFERDGLAISFDEQAECILRRIQQWHDQEITRRPGIGLIYSANYGQTREIQRVYLAGIVETDLDRIERHLQCGWTVLGWQNQRTIQTDWTYAIGGGIAQLPNSLAENIQRRLRHRADSYQG